MGSQTSIEWTDATWNPFTGCTKVDGDCKFCYMYRDKERYGQDPTTVVRSAPGTFNAILNPAKYPPGSKVFSASWSDWGHPDAAPHLPDAWGNVAKRPDLSFQLLSKRDWRTALPANWTAEGWPNVWLGTSIGSPKGADRVRALAEVSSVVRFLSVEPMWAPGVADAIREVVESGRIDWIIVGGESGPKARPMHYKWACEVRDLAAGAGVPLLFKQWGEWAPSILTPYEASKKPEERPAIYQPGAFHDWLDGYTSLRIGKKAAGRTLDGVVHDGYPVPRVGEVSP